MTDRKTCSCCRKDLPRSAFNRCAASPDGLQYYCRRCQVGYITDMRRIDPETDCARQRARYARRKAAA